MAWLWELEIKDKTKIAIDEMLKGTYFQWYEKRKKWLDQDGVGCTPNLSLDRWFIVNEPDKPIRLHKYLMIDTCGEYFVSHKFLDENNTTINKKHDRKIDNYWIEINSKGELVNWSGKES